MEEDKAFLKLSQLSLTVLDSGENAKNLRGVYSDTTQLNSTDPVEQRTAKSVVFFFLTSRPTN